MKLPYGISDFYKLATENYWFVDRTDRIVVMEKLGKTLLFLRPRRFGKSLWLSILEKYYDIAKKDQFERVFGHLAIGKNPTPRHNQYLIMRWDFSKIDAHGTIEKVIQLLHDHINTQIYLFIQKYAVVALGFERLVWVEVTQ